MSENENVGIELGVNVDGALQTLQELTTAAKAADATIQELKQHTTEQVNAVFGAQGLRPQNYEQAQGFLQRMPAADLQAAAPEIAATQQAISARSATITGAAMDVTGAPGAANQPVQQLLDQVRQLLTVQQQRAAGGVPDAGGSGASPQARYGGTPSGGSGSPWPAATSPFGGTSPTDATQQDRGANLIGQRMAEALTCSAGGLMAGGIQGAANAAGMGATGDLVGGLARPLMSMLGEFAAPLAAVVAVGAGGLAVNAQQAHYAQEQQALSGAVGTTTGATPLSELRSTQNVGWNYLYSERDSIGAANQLGQAGVLSNQMPGALNDAMALSRISGLDLGQTTDLTGGLMKAGASSTQVGDTYASLDEAARHSGVSLDRLVTSLKTLQQAAGASQLDVNGLAAAQKLAGSNVQVGQALAPLVGATGTDAMQQMAMLGLNPAQFAQAQAHPQVAWDAYASVAKRYDIGTYGTQTAESALQAAGLDMSGMSGQAASTLVQKLVSQGPRAAEDYAASLDKQSKTGAGPHNASDLYKQGVDAAQRVNSFLQQAEIHAEKIAADLLMAQHSVSAPMAAQTAA